MDKIVKERLNIFLIQDIIGLEVSMKLTKIQWGACIILTILIVILIVCYCVVPTGSKRNHIPKMKETALNQYVHIKKMTKDQYKNNSFYPYIKSFEKDIIELKGIDQKKIVAFQRELAITELEITNLLKTARANREKNTVEVKRKVTSEINDQKLIVTVFYHINNQKERYIQLNIDLNNMSVIHTQKALQQVNKEENNFSKDSVEHLLQSIEKENTITRKDDEKEISNTEFKDEKSNLISCVQANLNSFQYVDMGNRIIIYYTFDFVANNCGYQLSGWSNGNDTQEYVITK